MPNCSGVYPDLRIVAGYSRFKSLSPSIKNLHELQSGYYGIQYQGSLSCIPDTSGLIQMVESDWF